MARKKSELIETEPLMPPAIDPEAREAQMIHLAERCAEKQLREGTASAQVIVHYLRLATERDKLERENLRLQEELIKAKTQAISDTKAQTELYEAAIAAMKSYKGSD